MERFPIYYIIVSDISSLLSRPTPISDFLIDLKTCHQEKPPWKAVELQLSAVKGLWHERTRLDFRNGVLCRKWTYLDGRPDSWQIVLPKCYRTEFLTIVYTGATGGHFGRSKTEYQVRRRAYWPGWRDQIAMELRCCEQCAGYHRGKLRRQAQLQPFSAGEPFELITVDITGPHPKTSQGHEYLLTVIDLFSRYAEAYPLMNHTASMVADVLVNQFFAQYGHPRQIFSDRGPEFESELFCELCTRLGIEKLRSSFYNPRCNGTVERFHRTLNSMLAKVIDTNQRIWHERVPLVLAPYRAARHDATGYTPNFLAYGRENRAPIDLVMGDVLNDCSHYDSTDDYVFAMQECMRQAYDLAGQHLGKTTERRKDDFDRRVKPRVSSWLLGEVFQPKTLCWTLSEVVEEFQRTTLGFEEAGSV